MENGVNAINIYKDSHFSAILIPVELVYFLFGLDYITRFYTGCTACKDYNCSNMLYNFALA